MTNGYSDKKKVERDQDQRNISPFAKGSALQTGVLNQDYGGVLKLLINAIFVKVHYPRHKKWNKFANLFLYVGITMSSGSRVPSGGRRIATDSGDVIAIGRSHYMYTIITNSLIPRQLPAFNVAH